MTARFVSDGWSKCYLTAPRMAFLTTAKFSSGSCASSWNCCRTLGSCGALENDTPTDKTNRVRAWRAPRSACMPRTYAASYIVEGTGQRHAHGGLHLTPEQVHEVPVRRLKVIERTDVSARQLDERQSGQATYKTMSALARPSCASASAADYGAATWRERDALRSVRSNTVAVTGPAAR